MNQQDVPYSIPAVPNITNYTWVGPTGSHISDGIVNSTLNTLITTSAAVTVDYATSAGTLKVRGNNSCGSGSYLSTTILMPCRTLDKTNPEISVYPIPVQDQLYISGITDIDITIRDATGRIMIQQTKIDNTPVETGFLAPGIYFYEVYKGNEMISLGKLLKQ
jgi:hypothetical protein